MTTRAATPVQAIRRTAAATLVLLVLAAFILAIYVVIAVWLRDMVGGSPVWFSIAATILVAVAFEPVRNRTQRAANRIVHGTRATPYEVLSEVTQRLAAAESREGLLERMAAMLGAGTGATRAAVWLSNRNGFVTAAVEPPESRLTVANAAGLPGNVELIEEGGEVIGALTVESSRSSDPSLIEQRLMADLAGSAALVLRNLRLDADLATKARELQESRRRLVDAQDQERRRLERDLHDGAQQLVVALKVKLGLARRLAEQEHVEAVAELIDEMADDAQLAVDQIRSLARGIYPPLLQTEGLGATVPALAALFPTDIRIESHVRRRHTLEIEGAAYFCIVEAVANAAKHGRPPIRITVEDDADALTFSVADSGPGFDRERQGKGSGIQNMIDRLDTLDGRLVIDSTPGGSTTVVGSLPSPA